MNPRVIFRSIVPTRSTVLACVVAVLGGHPFGAAVGATAPWSQDWKKLSIASFDEAWQTIDETFYDLTFAGVDWGSVREELRPKVEAADTPDRARAVIVDMIGRLKRSHFAILSESAAGEAAPVGDAAPPLDVRVTGEGLIITRVDPGSSAARDGLSPGQLVVAIDGLSTAGWTSPGDTAAVRSAALEWWRRAYRALHGDAGSLTRLRVQSTKGGEREIATARIAPEATVTVGNLPPLAVKTESRQVTSPAGRIVGVIRFNVWMPAIDGPVAAAVDRFRVADGLVIDLRGNPGGLAVMMAGISGHLMTDASALVGRMQTRQATLEFHPNPRLSTDDGRRVTPFSGRVAILVDELTASTSECFAGGLQGLGRARVFGRQTMGQALPALTKRLSNGDVLMYAVGDFVTGAGLALEGRGVVPDEVVSLTRAVLAAGRDPDLDAALRWVDR